MGEDMESTTNTRSGSARRAETDSSPSAMTYVFDATCGKDGPQHFFYNKSVYTYGTLIPRGTPDHHWQKAYQMLDDVIEFYHKNFGWDGVDGKGMPLVGTFNYKPA